MEKVEKEMATHSGILAWRIPWIEEAGGPYTVQRVAKSRTRLSDLAHHVGKEYWFFKICKHGIKSPWLLLDKLLNLSEQVYACLKEIFFLKALQQD